MFSKKKKKKKKSGELKQRHVFQEPLSWREIPVLSPEVDGFDCKVMALVVICKLQGWF